MKNPQLGLTRKVKPLSDTAAGGLTILEVSRHSWNKPVLWNASLFEHGRPSATHVAFTRLDGPDRDDCDPDHAPDLLLTSAPKAYASPPHLTHCMLFWRET